MCFRHYDIIKAAVKDNNTNDICFTIKNYEYCKGLSNHLFKSLEGVSEVVEVKGPMGTGLDIQNKGTHVAFAAGTGILPFIDLVAHLILRIIG